MIKCNVCVCGKITRGAQLRMNKDNQRFTTFGVSVTIQAKNGINKTIEISVAKDGDHYDEIAHLGVNSIVSVKGVLLFHKRGDNLYWNISADEIVASENPNSDEIKGTMDFTGSAGKQIENKKDKKGNPYFSFSAYSCEKDGENFAYTWVRFRQFGAEQPQWLQPKSKIQVRGEVEFSIFNDRVDIGCVVREIIPWEKKPFQPKY